MYTWYISITEARLYFLCVSKAAYACFCGQDSFCESAPELFFGMRICTDQKCWYWPQKQHAYARVKSCNLMPECAWHLLLAAASRTYRGLACSLLCVFPNQRQGKHPITTLNSRYHVGLLRTFILLLGICQVFLEETIVIGWWETGICARIMEMAAKDFTSHCAFNFQKACEKAPGTWYWMTREDALFWLSVKNQIMQSLRKNLSAP